MSNTILRTEKGQDVNPRTRSQEQLAQTVDNNTVVFGVGPAGTGKTYVSIALAANALQEGDTDKVLLTRPAVQAGEDLGFLPGELDEKLAPYVRPFDAILSDFYSKHQVHNLKENGQIEYQPLGFLRGQTIDNCWAILDEAQNATEDQLRMFLTRLGPNAKALITGDPEQTDLPNPSTSALSSASRLLSSVHDITFVEFSEDEIVRHDVVKGVIQAYRKEFKRRAEQRDEASDSDGEEEEENNACFDSTPPDPNKHLSELAHDYEEASTAQTRS